MFGLGSTELIIILALVLIVFGAGKLPQVGGSLGKAISEFKTSVKKIDEEEEKGSNDTATSNDAATSNEDENAE